jgi:formylglycine-generating enzyme required for sulfatase activity
MRKLIAVSAVVLLASAASLGRAGTIPNVFNMPAGETSLDFVTVGNPGNAPDPATGSLYGSVSHTYQMGTYDVTSAQYCDFLNAVATTADTYGLYYVSMASTGSAGAGGCGIVQTSGSTGYTYSVLPGWANMPVNYATWGDAARFCNWLDNGQPVGPEGNGTTETGAYTLNGATSRAALMAVASPPHSSSNAPQYFLPSENEWYKAAYYDPSNGTYWKYPTQSNTPPSNVLSATGTNNANYEIYNWTDRTNWLTPVGSFASSPGPYGTYDMGGDVWQWNETAVDANDRGLSGGTFYDNSTYLASSCRIGYNPTYEVYGIGFRVASEAVPEPGSITLLLAASVGLAGAAVVRWWRRAEG